MTLDEFCADYVAKLKTIEHADERAQTAQAALTSLRAFDDAVIAIRDEALREMRRGDMSYGQIADLTGVGRSSVIAITRYVGREPEQTEMPT